MSAKPETRDSSITAILYQRPASPLAAVRTRRDRHWQKIRASAAAPDDDDFVMKPGSDTAVIVQGTRVFGRRMTFYRRGGLAAMLVLCSTALAAAGDAQFRVSDDFVLTGAQKDLIWQRMGREIPNDDDGAPDGCRPTHFS